MNRVCQAAQTYFPAMPALVFCLGFVIAASAPRHPPIPKKKPQVPAEDTTAPIHGTTGNQPTVHVPVPEKRPSPSDRSEPSEKPKGTTAQPETKAGDSESGDRHDTQESEPEPAPVPGIEEDGAALAVCYGRLDALGVVYSKRKTINGPGRCGIEAPVSVKSVLPGITLKPASRMRCKTALALAQWTKNVVEPSAERLGTHVRLTGLTRGSGYACRRRDSIATRKISQHAFGNAIDVVTFRFDGHAPLPIAPRKRTGKIEQGFQRAVIGGACLYFTTVLGPSADAFHQDNLHLDVDKRSHGFRLCQ